MGYLIGGAGEEAEQEINVSDNDYTKLSDAQLLKLREQTVKDIAKFNNFQMVRKICLNSAYGAIGNQCLDITSLRMLKQSLFLDKSVYAGLRTE